MRKNKISVVEEVLARLSEERVSRQEHLMSFSLSSQREIIKKHTVSIGTLNATLVHPRDVFYSAIVDNAAEIVIAHNHPEGSLEPSNADRAMTRRFREAGQLLGIPLYLHVLVTKSSYSVI
ncbi:JAB domain-containing protein [Candidatus Saccharibacteria bacterium]|nr:JAB domain-containing protein [Candidatus Saccharibacteria bacterium]